MAASPAATKPGSVSAAAPTAGTRTVPKDGSTIVTGGGSIGNAGRKRAIQCHRASPLGRQTARRVAVLPGLWWNRALPVAGGRRLARARATGIRPPASP